MLDELKRKKKHLENKYREAKQLSIYLQNEINLYSEFPDSGYTIDGYSESLEAIKMRNAKAIEQKRYIDQTLIPSIISDIQNVVIMMEDAASAQLQESIGNNIEMF